MLTLQISILFVLACLLTAWYRHYALSHRILDIPNERSAHQNPIPRGAGVVFVGLFLGVIVVFFPQDTLLYLSALGIAILGYWDDKRPIPALYRLVFHVVLSTMAIIHLGGMPALVLGGWTIHFGILTSIVGVVYLVGMLNLYNFMDGINGLAGFEAVCAASTMGVLYYILPMPEAVTLPLFLVAIVAGFLVWNFPFAKVFMGDAGSGFLGFVLGLWSLQAASVHPQLFWSWLIVLGVFIVDSSATLYRRMLRGDQLHIAHSSHAYQHAARRYGAHWIVTLAAIVINIVWLAPLAILVGLNHLSGILGLTIAYLPLIVIACYFKAGYPPS